MQNSLPDHDVACVSLVIAAGVQIAIVFREGRGGDGDAETMSCSDHSGRIPQIDVVLVSLAWLEQRPTIKAVAEARPHDAVLDSLCTSVRVDVRSVTFQCVSFPCVAAQSVDAQTLVESQNCKP